MPGLAADLPILWHLLRGMPRSGSHAERLQGFYRHQARGYDAFRERLLHGRRELIERIELPPGGCLAELGAGTGRNLEFLGDRLATLYRAWLVDLCPALLGLARTRCAEAGWANVRIIEADACNWHPPRPVDAVLCAYSLSMIPDWFAAVDNAHGMLAPGGLIAAVDFHLPRPHPVWRQAFWSWWFGHDGVHPSRDHLPYLLRRFQPVLVEERLVRLPWMPLRAPCYLFIGRRC